jgi:hypothetical protein
MTPEERTRFRADIADKAGTVLTSVLANDSVEEARVLIAGMYPVERGGLALGVVTLTKLLEEHYGTSLREAILG